MCGKSWGALSVIRAPQLKPPLGLKSPGNGCPQMQLCDGGGRAVGLAVAICWQQGRVEVPAEEVAGDSRALQGAGRPPCPSCPRDHRPGGGLELPPAS